MLEPFGQGLWIADGPRMSGGLGFVYPTRMAVIRLDDGALVIWSPVALSATLRKAVDGLGPVGYLVAPNTLHHSWLADWRAAYPAALIYGPPGLAAKRPDIALDGVFAEADMPGWAGQIAHVVVDHNRLVTEAVLFHHASKTAVFTDLLQHMPAEWFGGWRGLVARLDLMVAAAPAVPRKFRVAFSDRDAARAGIRRVLDWPSEQVLLAHGAPVRQDGQALLTRAFAWLMA